jgi:hypothetical protein
MDKLTLHKDTTRHVQFDTRPGHRFKVRIEGDAVEHGIGVQHNADDNPGGDPHALPTLVSTKGTLTEAHGVVDIEPGTVFVATKGNLTHIWFEKVSAPPHVGDMMDLATPILTAAGFITGKAELYDFNDNKIGYLPIYKHL